MNKNLSAWQVALLAACFNLITGLIIFGVTRNANGADNIKKQIEIKADKTYVDQQDAKLDIMIDKKADKESVKMMYDILTEIQKDTRETRNLVFQLQKK